MDNLAATRFRWPWLVFMGLALQLAVGPLLDERGDVAFPLLLLSTALIALFLLVNIHRPGMVIAGAGLILNLVVIGANGAMPVSRSAAAQIDAPITAASSGAKHDVMDDDTRLPWLGDWIPVVALKTVLSVGDIVLGLGLAAFVYRASKTPPAEDGAVRGSSD